MHMQKNSTVTRLRELLCKKRSGFGSRLKAYSTRIARYAVGATFMLAAIPKLSHPYDFMRAIYEYELLSGWTVTYIAIVLPWLELVLGAFLIIADIWTGGALLCSTFLLAGFVLIQLISIHCGVTDISCACFGPQSSEHLGLLTIARTAGLLSISLMGFVSWLMESSAE